MTTQEWEIGSKKSLTVCLILLLTIHIIMCYSSQPCAAQSSLKDMNWDQEQWKPLICE